MNNRSKDRLNKAIELNKQQAEFYNNISLKEDVELFTGYGRNESANFVTKIGPGFVMFIKMHSKK